MTPVQTNRTDALEPVLVHGYEEERLLRAARMFERETDWHRMRVTL